MEALPLSLNLPKGHQVLGFEALGSTSDLARQMGDAGDSKEVPFLWIWARLQTEGRGRRGREWQSREGNLTTTMLIRPSFAAEKGAELSFVAALAVAETVSRFVGEGRTEIKWPNDVLVDGKKIAGILLESAATSGADLEWLSIGMGINLAFHPEGTPYPATNLKELGASAEPLASLEVLSDQFNFWHGEWQSKGFPAIREAWMKRAKGLGEPVTARLANEEVSGIFEDFDRGGNLIIRLPSGDKRLISAGEVFFP